MPDATAEALWTDPDWVCPQCHFTNLAIRECSNGQVTAIPKTTGLSTFQANRTAMLLVNIAAIKAELTLESE